MNAHRRHAAMAIAVCLSLGAISTVALAWLCAAVVNPAACEAVFDHTARDDGGTDVRVIQRGFGHSRINRAKVDELVLDPGGGIRTARWSSDSAALSQSRAGWPLRCFACDNPSDVALTLKASAMRVQTGGPNAPVIRGGWPLTDFTGGSFGGAWRAVPFRPIWLGLVGDVLIHAAMWFTLIFGFATVRRSRRRHAGRCQGCGYDLRSSGVAHARCPECGR